MMTSRKVVEYVSAEPFRSFRIHMASGTTFDVGHPEMIKVGRSSVSVHMRPEGEDDRPEQWREVSLMLLEFVEPLDTTTLKEHT